MRSEFSRREFIAGVGVLAAVHTRLSATRFPSASISSSTQSSSTQSSSTQSGSTRSSSTSLPKSPFKIAVINDEISQDFGHACEVASQEFGMHWIELRSMWKKNIVSLDEKEAAGARRILDKFQLKVTDIASPLFKVDWPGAPRSRLSPKESQFNADFSFDLMLFPLLV